MIIVSGSEINLLQREPSQKNTKPVVSDPMPLKSLKKVITEKQTLDSKTVVLKKQKTAAQFLNQSYELGQTSSSSMRWTPVKKQLDVLASFARIVPN